MSDPTKPFDVQARIKELIGQGQSPDYAEKLAQTEQDRWRYMNLRQRRPDLTDDEIVGHVKAARAPKAEIDWNDPQLQAPGWIGPATEAVDALTMGAFPAMLRGLNKPEDVERVQRAQKQFNTEHPVASGLVDVVASAPWMLWGGGLNTANAPTAFGRAVQGGAKYGLASGIGHGIGASTTIPEIATKGIPSALGGMATGAVFGGATHAILSPLEKIGSWAMVRLNAKERARQAIGAALLADRSRALVDPESVVSGDVRASLNANRADYMPIETDRTLALGSGGSTLDLLKEAEKKLNLADPKSVAAKNQLADRAEKVGRDQVARLMLDADVMGNPATRKQLGEHIATKRQLWQQFNNAPAFDKATGESFIKFLNDSKREVPQIQDAIAQAIRGDVGSEAAVIGNRTMLMSDRELVQYTREPKMRAQMRKLYGILDLSKAKQVARGPDGFTYEIPIADNWPSEITPQFIQNVGQRIDDMISGNLGAGGVKLDSKAVNKAIGIKNSLEGMLASKSPEFQAAQSHHAMTKQLEEGADFGRKVWGMPLESIDAWAEGKSPEAVQFMKAAAHDKFMQRLRGRQHLTNKFPDTIDEITRGTIPQKLLALAETPQSAEQFMAQVFGPETQAQAFAKTFVRSRESSGLPGAEAIGGQSAGQRSVGATVAGAQKAAVTNAIAQLQRSVRSLVGDKEARIIVEELNKHYDDPQAYRDALQEYLKLARIGTTKKEATAVQTANRSPLWSRVAGSQSDKILP